MIPITVRTIPGRLICNKCNGQIPYEVDPCDGDHPDGKRCIIGHLRITEPHVCNGAPDDQPDQSNH
jgi:hypothetical protein